MLDNTESLAESLAKSLAESLAESYLLPIHIKASLKLNSFPVYLLLSGTKTDVGLASCSNTLLESQSELHHIRFALL